jgi:hypothetical protein
MLFGALCADAARRWARQRLVALLEQTGLAADMALSLRRLIMENVSCRPGSQQEH